MDINLSVCVSPIRFRADLALLSSVAIDAERGASSFLAEEAEIARAMCANARRTVILADYSKIGMHSRIAYCAPGDVALVVTNRRARRLPCTQAMEKAYAQIEYV